MQFNAFRMESTLNHAYRFQEQQGVAQINLFVFVILDYS